MAIALAALPFAVFGGIGYGLTYIKDHLPPVIEMLSLKVKRVTTVIKTNKIARIFAGIFTFGLTELMNHEEEKVEYFINDTFIGTNKIEAAKNLFDKGKECYSKGDYQSAASYFEAALDLNKLQVYKQNLDMARERETTAKREQEEMQRLAQARQTAMARERETAAKREQEEMQRLAIEQARQKALLKDVNKLYEKAKVMESEELKFRAYASAVDKCKQVCSTGTSEEAFNTLNNIFESCNADGAFDEADSVCEVVREYFPNKVDWLQKASVDREEDLWIPDYQNKIQSKEHVRNQSVVMGMSFGF